MRSKIKSGLLMSYLLLNSGCALFRSDQQQQAIWHQTQQQKILSEKIATCERYKAAAGDCQLNNKTRSDHLKRLNGEANCLRNKGYRPDVNYCAF